MSLTQYGFRIGVSSSSSSRHEIQLLVQIFSAAVTWWQTTMRRDCPVLSKLFFLKPFHSFFFFKMIIKGISIVFIYLWLLNQLLKQMHLFDFILWLHYFQLTVWYGYNLCAYFMRLVLEFLYLDWQKRSECNILNLVAMENNDFILGLHSEFMKN